MERLFVLKTLSRTQRATKVKKFVGFSLKPLRCRDPALPPLYGHAYSRPFFSCTRMRIYRVYTRMIHRRGFSTLVLFITTCSYITYTMVECEGTDIGIKLLTGYTVCTWSGCVLHPMFMQHSNGTHLCISVSELVSCTFVLFNLKICGQVLSF